MSCGVTDASLTDIFTLLDNDTSGMQSRGRRGAVARDIRLEGAAASTSLTCSRKFLNEEQNDFGWSMEYTQWRQSTLAVRTSRSAQLCLCIVNMKLTKYCRASSVKHIRPAGRNRPPKEVRLGPAESFKSERNA